MVLQILSIVDRRPLDFANGCVDLTDRMPLLPFFNPRPADLVQKMRRGLDTQIREGAEVCRVWSRYLGVDSAGSQNEDPQQRDEYPPSE